MKRRSLLATATGLVGMGALAGCLRTDTDPADPDGTASPATSSPPPTESPTASTTADDLPEDCQPLPEIRGLPSRPETLTEESVRAYVTEFERIYAVATNDEYVEVTSLTVERVADDRGYYQASLEVEVRLATETPTSDDSTATAPPPDATEYQIQYLLPAGRLVRERRGMAGGSLIATTCWSVPGEESGTAGG